MRSLTSVQSATHIIGYLSATVALVDQSTVFAFDHRDLASLGSITWEIDPLGGISKPVTYQMTLSTSLGWIKENILRLPRATVRLRVDVNRDTFFPHVGVVRGLTRDGRDPNLLSLSVYDALLDADTKFPVVSLADSYSTLHQAVIADDMGEPRYYGYHHRPFYHIPVDTTVSDLIGPKNVSSASRVSSVHYCSSMKDGYDVACSHNILVNKIWAQQSGSTNLVTGGYPFEVIDSSAADTRLWRYSSSERRDNELTIESDQKMDLLSLGKMRAEVTYGTTTAGYKAMRIMPIIEQREIGAITKSTRCNYTLTFSGATGIRENTFTMLVESGDGLISYQYGTGATATITGSVDVSGTDARYLFVDRDRKRSSFEYYLEVGTSASGSLAVTSQIQLGAQLDPSAYTNYSFFSPIVNSSDLAISSNPIRIIDDMLSVASVGYVQSQSSVCQVAASGYNFNALFYARKPLSEILDDFGKHTGQYMWLGDSGMLNFRAYQESASATVNRTITTSDAFPTFSLVVNPVGVTQYSNRFARRVKVDYDYNYTTGAYQKSLTAGPHNSTLCANAQTAGVKTELAAKSDYILSTDVATRYLGHLVRFATQDEEYIEMRLPARFYTLELCDVIRVHHPMIVGSEATYQISQITHDYAAGGVSLRAFKLVGL